MAPFYGWGSTVSWLESCYKETVYFLPLSPKDVLVLILSILEGWKAESTLELTSGFEPGSPGFPSWFRVVAIVKTEVSASMAKKN